MIGKPNWVCSICGMFSSRRGSVKRHILNEHAGIGLIISFIDYLTGRLAGYYPPRSPPLYVSGSKKKTEDKVKDIPKKATLMDLVSEGYWREFGAQMARNKTTGFRPGSNIPNP